MLISKCILLDRGYETIVCGLQTAKHGGIIVDYLSFEYLLVLIYLLGFFTSYTGDVNKKKLYDLS
jgi:hypothetical protein